MSESISYTVSPARYSKGAFIVRCPSGDGYKTRAARIACAINGRWTNREKGYVMSPRKRERFEELYAKGWDASAITRVLIAP